MLFQNKRKGKMVEDVSINCGLDPSLSDFVSSITKSQLTKVESHSTIHLFVPA